MCSYLQILEIRVGTVAAVVSFAILFESVPIKATLVAVNPLTVE
jgi:hypothetical protein